MSTTDRVFDREIAKSIRRIVIQSLIEKARSLPHHPTCRHGRGDGAPCTCFCGMAASWLEGEAHK